MKQNKIWKRKIFVFKYALTKGIIEVDAEIKQGTHEEYAKSKNKMDIMWLNKDYVHTKEEALKKAEDMRLSKIESLKSRLLNSKK